MTTILKRSTYIPSIAVALFDRAEAAYQGQTCATVMLCSASMEAFINEYLEFGSSLILQNIQDEKEAEERRKRNVFITNCKPFHSKEKKIFEELQVIENKRQNIFEKMNLIRAYCDGSKWDKGKDRAYQNYCTLIKIRNELVHPRSKAVRFGDTYIPKFLNAFEQQKKVNYLNKINMRMSWVEAIENKNFAYWCLKTFQEMMESLLYIMGNTKIESSPYFPSKTSQFAKNYLDYYSFKKINL